MIFSRRPARKIRRFLHVDYIFAETFEVLPLRFFGYIRNIFDILITSTGC